MTLTLITHHFSLLLFSITAIVFSLSLSDTLAHDDARPYPVWLQMVQRFRRYDIPCLVTNGSKVQKICHTLFGYKWFKGSEDMTYPVWLQMVQRFRRYDIPCLVTNGSKVQKT